MTARGVGDEIKSFEEILNNWVSTPGFPVITVIRNYVNETVIIHQSRFLYKNDTIHNEKYWIPINYLLQNDSTCDDNNPVKWLSPLKTPSSLEIKGLNQNGFVIFNKQQTGKIGEYH